MDQRPPPTPRSRKPRVHTGGSDDQVSVALALTLGELAGMDASARIHGVSRRIYMGWCLDIGLTRLAKDEIHILAEKPSAHAAFISIRVDADTLARLDKIVIANESNRRWVASVAILAGRAFRLHKGMDKAMERSASRKHTDERLAIVEKRLEELEKIVADKLR